MIKVVKFGGSSLADAVQIKKAGKIVLSEESRRYVVPSAPGKRFSDDTKVTDMLYRCYGAAVKEKKFTELLADIQKRYQEIIEGLGITLSLDEEFATIRDNFAKKIGRDYAASRGEYLNGRVIAAFLGCRQTFKSRACRDSWILRSTSGRNDPDIFPRRI